MARSQKWKGKNSIIDSNQSIEFIQKKYGNPALTTYQYCPLENGSETSSDIWYNRLIKTGGRVYTYDKDKLMSLADVWSDISHLHQKDPERTGYATQKPEALLERIILASSEDDDLVLDCFCGSGVTPAVAEQLGRRWIACDKSEMAITTSCERLLLRERRRPFVLQQVTES